MGLIIAERPPLFVPTLSNFSRGNKQTMNSTDLSEIKKAVIYMFFPIKKKLYSNILIVALSYRYHRAE